ncbi:acetate/propionate family kinase [Xylanimonas protaetiae]|uniref:Acetate kinase n=1 Tax=Xylanimonas protaetiae TaxID=2509457 RepID=A0A4P6F480_9MICO|nr:acetate kinase [Xylanimonas protaetiae]QAY70146.1 acetate kinase [Xylanimonas protaetiae]
MSTVLVLNSGSSSLKYQLLNPSTGDVLAVGLVERIGLESGRIVHEVGDEEHEREAPIKDHGVALHLVLDLFKEVGPSLDEAGIVAVGHRVVHGGTHYSQPTVIDDDVVEGIRALVPLAPLHNPANLTGIEAARELFDVPHVAVFDTAFFATLPPAAYTYAIDADVAAEHQVRRYGFHGTSHQYVSAKVAEVLGRDDLKQVVLHLGNGASASAVVDGVAVDTSMGLTPLEGLVMGTRSGDLDPAIVFHLKRVAGMDVDDIDDLLNKKSGLLGLSGRSDMRDLRNAADAGDATAIAALDVYRRRLVKYVGAYAAVLGGIDVLTFTAGVGENSFPIRQEVADALGFLGLAVDPAKNQVRSKEPRIISPDGHEGPLVMVVPTNEELAIARQSVAAIA